MKITIVGQGAIGLLWYSHLYREAKQNNSTEQLTLFTSPSDDGNTSHLSYTDYQQHTQLIPIIRADKKATISNQLVLICVKSYQVNAVLRQLSPLIADNVDIILSHNGMGTLDEIPCEIKERSAVYQLLTTHGCKKSGNFNICHTGLGFSDLGQVSGPIDLNKQQTIFKLLVSAMPTVNWQQDILSKQWIKLAINCVINPITALNNCDNGAVAAKKYQLQIKNILRELIKIAELEGYHFEFDNLYQIVLDVADKTARNSSSMRCDMLNNQPTEIDYINGFIHRLGQKWQVATPENSRLWQQVKALNT